MKESILYSLLLFILLSQCSSQQNQSSDQLHVIRKYVSHLQSDYFVSLGSHQEMNSAIAQELKGWNGIFLEEDTQRTKFSILNSVQVETLAFRISNETEENPASYSITLSEVCSNYYLKKPKMMILTDSSDHYEALLTNDWNQNACQPDFIIILPTIHTNTTRYDQFISALRKFGYGNDPFIGKIRIFVKMSQIHHLYLSFLQNQRRFAKSNHTMFVKEKNLPSLYKYLLPNTIFDELELLFPEKIYFYDMKYHILSLPDAIEASEYLTNEPRPIVILNYRSKKDAVYIGSTNYTIQQFKIDDFLFKHIQVTLEGQIDYDVYILLDQQSKWIQILEQSGEKAYEQKSGIIRRSYFSKGCIEVQEKLKVSILNRQRFQTPLGVLFKKDAIRPYDRNRHKQYHQSDNTTDILKQEQLEIFNHTETTSNTMNKSLDSDRKSQKEFIQNEKSVSNQTEQLMNNITIQKDAQNSAVRPQQQAINTSKVVQLEKEMTIVDIKTQQLKQKSQKDQSSSQKVQPISKDQSKISQSTHKQEEEKDKSQISKIITELSKQISFVNEQPIVEDKNNLDGWQEQPREQTGDTSGQQESQGIFHTQQEISENQITEPTVSEEDAQVPNDPSQDSIEQNQLQEVQSSERPYQIDESNLIYIGVALLGLLIAVCYCKKKGKNAIRNVPVQLHEDEFGESSERF